MTEITIRGMVLSKYKTIGAFADRIGWSKNKASRIINQKQEPDILEMKQLADCLDIHTPEDFMGTFFGDMSTKWTS